jgi:hypothetical protein
MSDVELPTTRYARSGDISVAYQTMGHGSIDLIVILGIISHVEFMHEMIPGWTDLLRRMAAFARVVSLISADRASLIGCPACHCSKSGWMT